MVAPSKSARTRKIEPAAPVGLGHGAPSAEGSSNSGGVGVPLPPPCPPPAQEVDASVEMSVGNEAYEAMLNPPVLQRAPVDHLKRLKKKVHDGLTEPARGVVIGTGIIGLDMIMQRGVNFGSCHEFYGFSKSAKSYIMQKIAAMAQRVLPDCYVVIYDRENAYDAKRVLSIGFDPARTIIIPSRMIPEPDHLFDQMREQMDSLDAAFREMNETAEDKAKKAAKAESEDPTNTKKKGKSDTLYSRDYHASKSPHIIHLIDSVPAFAEQEAMTEDQGRRAKKWHAIMRRVTGFLDPKVMVLFSNHIIYKPGLYSTKQKSSGTALDLYRDTGMELSKISDLVDENGIVIGTVTGAEVDKTRRGPSGAHTYFPIYFRDGAPQFSGILPYMEYLGLATCTNSKTVKESKAWIWPNYQINGVKGTVSEKDVVHLEKVVREHGILGMIAKREKEKITL